jgi:hypothetical protein
VTTTPEAAHGGGLLTYLLDEGDTVAIYLQLASGAPIALVTGADEAAVLDYTQANGGLFALLVVEGGDETITIVRADGSPVESGINPGWDAVVEADWSADGQQLVVEARNGGETTYVFLSAEGTVLGEPDFGASGALPGSVALGGPATSIREPGQEVNS